jgi:cysteine desulfuration protein SufE
MTIQERTASIVATLNSARDWQARYKQIIELGRALPPMPEGARVDANKVKGCQSQVWLDAAFEDGSVVLQGDSDAAIVKGLVAVVLHVYSGATPQEILATPPTFIDELGLSSNLSQTRANGLSAMIKQIQLYAVAFHALASRS